MSAFKSFQIHIYLMNKEEYFQNKGYKWKKEEIRYKKILTYIKSHMGMNTYICVHTYIN